MSIKWVAMQPLLGGMCLGAEKAFGSLPPFVVSYKGVGNDAHYMDYLKKESSGKDVPYLVLDSDLLSGAETFQTEEMQKIFNENKNDIDVVSAVPICSGLSMANSNNNKDSKKARGSDAQQNDNMLNMARFALKQMGPKAYIFENAPGLYTTTGKGVRDKLYELAKEFKYSITFINTNSSKHGNVQARPRAFCIFWKSEFAPMIGYYNDTKDSIVDYLSQITEDATLNDKAKDTAHKDFSDNVYYKYITSKFGLDYRKEMMKMGCNTIAQVIQTNKDWDYAKQFATDREKEILDHYAYKISLGKGYWDNSHHYLGSGKVPSIISKNMWRLIHPEEERYYTARELMKFMGLPDDFELVGGIKNVIHITQNVPVNTAKDWHLEVKKFIEGKLEMSNSDLIMHNNLKQTQELVNKQVKGFDFKKVVA